MPYVFDDKDFKSLKQLAEDVVGFDKPMSMVKQRLLGAALMFLLGNATKARTPDEIDNSNPGQDGDAIMLQGVSELFSSLLEHLANEMGGIVMGKVNGVPWYFADELAPEVVGLIPSFFNVDDERPLREQIDERYISGWHPMQGFKIKRKSWTIAYPGDPDMQPMGGMALHGEVLAVYPHAWVMIVQEDFSYEIARMD